MTIIFSTCWYILKAKFDKEKYKNWMGNFLTNVNNFYLVIYTNKESYCMLEKYASNPKIKIVFFELEEFYNYKYKNFWIENHTKNTLLNNITSWQLNMLWSEKISFVKKTYDDKYFHGDWYGWCDIGYFRGRNNDMPNHLIKLWPNSVKISSLNKDKIYYANVNNNKNLMNIYIKCVLNKNEKGLPSEEIPSGQNSIAGGFFLVYNDKIDWWHRIYDEKLKLYFENNYLVKDDQIIVLDSVISNLHNFSLIQENSNYDNWFLFQRYLF